MSTTDTPGAGLCATPPPMSGPAGATGAWRVRIAAQPLGAGEHDGPLRGIRVAVKDLFAVAGQRIGAGNPTVLKNAPIEPVNSVAVQALVDAGATVAGIARTDELAFSIAGINAHEGFVVNPARPGCLVGGSTSGPAAAVVAGEAELGLGTDTAGSIRVPASYCGLWGLRMTHGLAPTDGLRPLAPSFDAIGLLSTEPALLRRSARILGAPEPTREILRVRIPSVLLTRLGPRVRESFLDSANELAARHGIAEVEPAAVDWSVDDLEVWFLSFRALQAYEAWGVNQALIQIEGAISAEIRARLAAGEHVDPEPHRAVLKEARRALELELDGDAVLCLPSTAQTAPRAGISSQEQEILRGDTLRLTFLASLAGLPALSAPLIQLEGAPLGLGLIGAPGDELALIDYVGTATAR